MSVNVNQIAETPRILLAQAPAPSTGAGRGSFFSKDVGGGESEGAYADELGTVIQLTADNAIYLANNIISDLFDVDNTAPANGQVLAFNTGTSKYEPSTPAGGGPDANAIHDNVAAEISVIAEKLTPSGNDYLLIEDASDADNKKRIRISTLPADYDTSAIHDDEAGEIIAITEKVTPVAADVILIEDSADTNNKKRIQIGNLPGGAGTDADAIHDNVASEISAVAEKVTPVAGDFLLIEDSADTNNKKRIQVGNLPAAGGTPEVFEVILPDAANLAARIALATTPSGWSITSADLDGETQFGADSEALVMVWDGGTKLASINVFDNNTSAAAIGGVKLTANSHSHPSNIKVNSLFTKAVVQFSSIGGLPAGRDVHVQVILS